MFASSAGQAVAAPACVATRDRRTILRTRQQQKRCCSALARGAETRAFSSPARDRPSSARGDRFTRRVAELNEGGPSARGERTRADSVAEGASSSGREGLEDRPEEKDPTNGRAEPEETSGGDIDSIAQLLSRADGAVHQAFVSLLGGDLDARVPARRPPPLGSMVQIAGPAPELDWHRATRTDAQRRELIASLATGRFREPCILRGAADEWPAVCDASKAWTLSRLVADHGSFAGDVRVRSPEGSAANGVPKDGYAYVEEAHEAVRSGKFNSPSRTVKMPLREAAARMVRNGDGEGGVYVQALITDELAREAGLTPGLSSSSNAEGEQARSEGEGEGEPSEPWRSMDRAGWRETQPPRLWLSAAGSTSPLHFDSSASVLAQVTGTKRMLLYPPSALSRAHLYPDWHPLRRRSKVRLDADVDVDDARRAFPRWTGSRFADEPSSDSSSDSSNDSEPFEETAGTHASPPGAWEAVLGPGDVLVFPPRWAHYTESLGPNMCASVTRRFETPRCDVSDSSPHPLPSSQDWPTGVTPESLERSARFARWIERRGLVSNPFSSAGPTEGGDASTTVSEGRRALRQLVSAGLLRPIGIPLRLDDAGRVVTECCAMGKVYELRRKRGGDGGSHGRGGAAQWASQWWAAANDAAEVITETFHGDEKFATSVQHSTDTPVVGVYARGSVARGEARAGVSDVDLVAVLWGHDTADGVRTMARAKRVMRTRLNSKPGDESKGESKGDTWLGRWGHLATKADVRVVTVPPPPHPAGAALAAAIAGEPLARQSPEAVAALRQCLGSETIFVLAVECAPIHGPDLPMLLPPSARTPPVRCLRSLNADVIDALADGGERALIWALKRCIRAAFEREMTRSDANHIICCKDEGCGEYTVGDGDDGNPDVTVEGRVYTRDLYHCAGLVSDARPELGEDLAAALCAAVHGPRAVWGALWYASGSALCVRLRDAVTYSEGGVGPR